MEPQRLRSIVGSGFLLALFLFFPLSDFLFRRSATTQDLFGFAAGIVVGGMVCVYLNRLWDPIHLKPLRPDPAHPPWWVRHALPITVVLAGTIGAISRLLFGETLTRSLSLGGVGVISTILGYFIIRLWWYRPRS